MCVYDHARGDQHQVIMLCVHFKYMTYFITDVVTYFSLVLLVFVVSSLELYCNSKGSCTAIRQVLHCTDAQDLVRPD